ncbi:hypothetical protein CYMTET_45974, partial [Cymbomonas tetramitiformis]
MERISVSVRVRPLNSAEQGEGGEKSWRVSGNSLLQLGSGDSVKGTPFVVDHVFDTECNTLTVYENTAQELIHSVVDGFNGTIFAYGQTSSGKTHTMRGSPEEPGVIPRSVQDVFSKIEASRGREFLLRVSYMELYNEEIKDLLLPSKCKLQVHEDNERGIYVAGLHEEIVTSPEQVLTLMDKGEHNRHVGETNMNQRSSRSHTIFRMVIESRDCTNDEGTTPPEALVCDAVLVATLHLVDLAGSERISKTGAAGSRMKEGVHINKSLSVLGNVINKLSEGGDKVGGHIPYRDSKLTRILQPALGGNAKTAIICNVTPSALHADETKGTLHFACRAKNVTNSATVNEILTDQALLRRQKKEIEELRQKLEGAGQIFDEETINELRKEMFAVEQQKQAMAMQLEEEREQQVKKQQELDVQAKKIENLQKLVLVGASQNQQGAQSDSEQSDSLGKKGSRRITWCGKASEQRKMLESSVGKRRKMDAGFAPGFETLEEEQELEMGTEEAASPLCQEPSGRPPANPSGEQVLPTVAGPASESRESPASAQSHLHTRLRELEMENKFMQRELDSVTDLARQLQENLTHEQSTREEAEREVLQLKHSSADLEAGDVGSDAEMQIKQLQQKLQEMQEAYSSAVRVNAEHELRSASSQALEARADEETLSEEAQRLRAALPQGNTDDEVSVQALKEQLATLEQEKLTWRTQMDASTQQVVLHEATAAAPELELLRGQLAQSEQKITALRGESARLGKELKAASAAPKSLQKEVEVLRKEVERSREKNGQTDAKLRQALQEKSAALQEKASMEKEAKRLRNQSSALSKQEGHLEKKREKVAGELGEARAQVVALEGSLQKAVADLEAAQQTTLEMAAEREGLQAQLAESSSLVESLNQQTQMMQDALAAAIEVKQVAEHDIASARLQLEKLQSQHSETHQQLESSQAALGVAEGKLPLIDELQRELEKLQSQHSETQQQLESSQAALGVAEGKLPLIDELQQEVKTMTEQLDMKTGKEEDSGRQIAALQHEAQSLKQELEVQLAAQLALEQEVSDARAARTEALQSQAEAQKLREEMTGHTEAAEVARAEAQELCKSMARLGGARDQAWAEVERLREEAKVQQDLREASEKHEAEVLQETRSAMQRQAEEERLAWVVKEQALQQQLAAVQEQLQAAAEGCEAREVAVAAQLSTMQVCAVDGGEGGSPAEHNAGMRCVDLGRGQPSWSTMHALCGLGRAAQLINAGVDGGGDSLAEHNAGGYLGGGRMSVRVVPQARCSTLEEESAAKQAELERIGCEMVEQEAAAEAARAEVERMGSEMAEQKETVEM